MSRSDLDVHFKRIDLLVNQFNHYVPADIVSSSIFRADLAGLLVVTICASYESCVKETLITYASNHHVEFGIFASNNFGKLNSRINMNDLHKYAGAFGEKVSDRFSTIHDKRKNRIQLRIGQNIETAYKQVLRWRHDFAHEGVRNSTIEETMNLHRLAKRVLYSFDEAFNGK